MKKTYIAPVASVFTVTATTIIATSIPVDNNAPADNNYPGGGDTKADHNLWDTEW